MPNLGAFCFHRIGNALTALVLRGIAASAGCSFNSNLPTEGPGASLDLSSISFTLTPRRASMTSQDFELYKLMPAGLSVECGVMPQGRPDI